MYEINSRHKPNEAQLWHDSGVKKFNSLLGTTRSKKFQVTIWHNSGVKIIKSLFGTPKE